MTLFVHDLISPRVVFGEGALRRVPEEAEHLGRRVLVIGGGSAAGAAGELAAAFGDRLAGRFSDIVQHVPVDVARQARQLAGQAKADVLVAVGGGSAIGTAKAVAMELELPVLAVPTTYAGSEMTAIWGLTDSGRKLTGRDGRVLAKTVVYDPLLTVSMPPALTAASGLNAMAHAVEALYAPDRTPLLELIALEAIRRLSAALRSCVADGRDTGARSEALCGAWLAGMALANTTMGLHHKLAHVLGGTWRLPHGPLHAALLPYVVACNAPYTTDGLGALAAALGSADPAAGLWDLAHDLGAPTSLRSVGFTGAAVAEAVEQTLANPPVNPAPVTAPAVMYLLTSALSGVRPGTAAR